MSKAFSFLGMVIALWIVMEFYANGIEGAFGGVLASDTKGSNPVMRTERAADAFEHAYAESTDRVDRMLED